LSKVLNAVAETYSLPVIVTVHPRTQNRIDKVAVKFHADIKLLKPLGFKDYNKLQLCSSAVLSDSGTINEESSILKFPALNMREVHERPEGMEEAAVMMVGLEVERVLQGLSILKSQHFDDDFYCRVPVDYSVPNVSDKIVRILYSYRDYVMRMVWKQY